MIWFVLILLEHRCNPAQDMFDWCRAIHRTRQALPGFLAVHDGDDNDVNSDDPFETAVNECVQKCVCDAARG